MISASTPLHVIKPIHKASDKLNLNNYRSINSTFLACEVMESVINDIIKTFFREHNVVPVKQHGMTDKSIPINLLLKLTCFDQRNR